MPAAAPTADVESFLRAIARGDDARALEVLAGEPSLATRKVDAGATRDDAHDFFITEVEHNIYKGDTALHIAAAAYNLVLGRALLDRGADIDARNRLGAAPLHYAALGNPNGERWNPRAQAAMIALLAARGANPNAVDRRGVSPLHVAVRVRSAAAVRALLDAGANLLLENRNGSTPLDLTRHSTGRSGVASDAAREQREMIVAMLSDAAGTAGRHS